jgi:hypothetical protein
VPTYAETLNWQPVNYSNPDTIKNSGLTVEEFNNLTQADWNKLLSNKEKLNFAFSATNSHGEDITYLVNPNLSIAIDGLNANQTVLFKELEKTDPTVIDEYVAGNIFSNGWITWSGVDYDLKQAFDGVVGARNNGWMIGRYSGGYIGYIFDNPKEIIGVSLAQGPNIYKEVDARCKDFNVEYYDGEKWVLAYSNTLSKETVQLQDFTFKSSGKHNKWRIFIINHHYDNLAYVGLSEIKFIEK